MKIRLIGTKEATMTALLNVDGEDVIAFFTKDKKATFIQVAKGFTEEEQKEMLKVMVNQDISISTHTQEGITPLYN